MRLLANHHSLQSDLDPITQDGSKRPLIRARTIILGMVLGLLPLISKAQTNLPGPLSVNAVPVLDQTYYTVTNANRWVIAAGARIHGEYSFGIESSQGAQTARISVDANQFDPSSTIHILENHSYNNIVVMSNFRLVRSADGVLVFLVVDVGNLPAGETDEMYVQYLATSDYPGGSAFDPPWGLQGNEVVSGVIGLGINEGNVGIGTMNPSAKLEVNGNTKLDGNILISGSGAYITFPDNTIQSTAWNGTTLGGDYAEAVDVLGKRAAYEPGDVIVIDATVSGKFIKSDKPYSRMVAGVFSTKPGLVGRRTTADRPDKNAEVPMAMIGIVPTKVSAENGPIERGDLLVSSGTPGYAMKATDASRMMGAVIGKALNPLKTGKGVLEVLVSLQ